MASNVGLLAAVTTTGLVLSLTLPVNASERAGATFEASAGMAQPLSDRVDRLKAKLRATLPSQGKIENIVQFFNFSNCSRGGWTKC
jgi:hypothetical protein